MGGSIYSSQGKQKKLSEKVKGQGFSIMDRIQTHCECMFHLPHLAAFVCKELLVCRGSILK